MTARWAMTGFAAHVDLLVMRIEPVIDSVVALFNISAVALGAACIPIEEASRPVQGIASRDFLIGVEVVPALPTFAFGTGIPSDGKRLQSAVAQRKQILLKRLDAEYIFHWESVHLASGIISGDQKSLSIAGKGRGDAKILKGCVIEVAQHRLRCGLLHSEIVMGVCPVDGSLFVTTGAGGIAEVEGVIR